MNDDAALVADGIGNPAVARPRVVAFDIDGTLVLSIRLHQQAMAQAMAASSLIHKDTVWSNYRNHTDSGIFWEAFEKSFGRAPTNVECLEFEALFDQRFTALMQSATLDEVSGASAFLRALEGLPDWTVVYASGSFRRAAEIKLESLGVPEMGRILVTASEFRTREEIVREAVHRASIETDRNGESQIISVGDGEWDIRTARALDLGFVGVGSGDSARALTALGARHVFENFVDPGRVMAAFESTCANKPWIKGVGLD